MAGPPSSAELSLPAPASARRADWAGRACAATLAVWTVVVYGPTFSAPFLFDDLPAIVNNATLRHWGTALRPPLDTTTSGRPVLNLSLALNYAISGTSVWSYHTLNLVIHLLAGLTLFGILRRTLARLPSVDATLPAFLIALLWSVHPLQTESVTYVVQRAESLMGLFYLLTLYCFIRSAEAEARRPPLRGRSGGRLASVSTRWAALSILACFFGMATKEVMVSAPVIVLLYDRTFLAGGFRQAWRLRWRVYAGLAATWLILPCLILSTHGRAGTVGFGSGISWWGYEQTQFPALLLYLKRSFWPHPLIFDYGVDRIPDPREIIPCALLVLGLLAAIAWGLLRRDRKGPLTGTAVAFAGAWYFAILAPTSLVPGNRQTEADHRMYLALIPVIALAVVGINHWLRRATLPACLVPAAALCGLAWQRNVEYLSPLDLWTDTVDLRPGNAFAHDNLGSILDKLPGRLNDAIDQYRTALRLKPDYAEAHNNLGLALAASGRLAEAVASYQRALRITPRYPDAENNLGVALTRLGRPEEALPHFFAALRLEPEFAAADSNLGLALADLGRFPEAIPDYEAALRTEATSAELHYNLAVALRGVGREQEAFAHLKQAVQLEPDLVPARENLGIALAEAGRWPEAIVQFETALRFQPNDANSHLNLGVALRAVGRTDEAAAQFKLATDLGSRHVTP